MPTLLIKNASQILTLWGPPRPRVGAEMRKLGIVENGSVLLKDEKIAQVGGVDETVIEPDGPVETMDAEGGVVMPAFIDAHTHPIFAGDRVDEFEQRILGRTYQEIAAAGGGISATVSETRRASDRELLQQARRFMKWFIAGGTTTIEAKTGYGLNVSEELRALRLIARMNREGPLEWIPTLLAAHTVPEEYRGRRKEYIRSIIEEILPRVACENLAEYADAFCEESAFTVEETRTLLLAARSVGLRIRLHANQFSRSGAAELAADLCARTADHLEQVDDSIIDQLRAAQVIAILLPASVYCLTHRDFPPARRMIELGLPVVLASDFNPGTAPTTSIPFVLGLASTQMRMTPAETIVAATVNAAYSLDRGDRLGTLEPGKQADLLILGCRDYRHLVYHIGVPLVRTVIKKGSVIYSAR